MCHTNYRNLRLSYFNHLCKYAISDLHRYCHRCFHRHQKRKRHNILIWIVCYFGSHKSRVLCVLSILLPENQAAHVPIAVHVWELWGVRACECEFVCVYNAVTFITQQTKRQRKRKLKMAKKSAKMVMANTWNFLFSWSTNFPKPKNKQTNKQQQQTNDVCPKRELNPPGAI